MSNFSLHKQMKVKPTVMKPIHLELNQVPERFCDYMNRENSRFSEICSLYLGAMSMDDIKFLKPEDFINLVPHNHYEHKLLMTIMVRRYLFKFNDCDDASIKDNASSDDASLNSRVEYVCDKCAHSCRNSQCDHSCDDYMKLSQNKTKISQWD
jgi:hypothetical protein